MSEVDDNNKYYIAYCAILKNKEHYCFGDTIITNKNKLKMNTEKDIENVKDFIIKKMKERNNIDVKNITIMDFRELEENNE